MQLQFIYLKNREERRLLAGHLWIYSNEIDTKKSPLSMFKVGELVTVKTCNNKNLGIAYINPHNLLCARLLCQNNEVIDQDFFERSFKRALILRKHCFKGTYYRAIFAESDYLPGLVVDRFGDHLVVQITTAGMENLKDKIVGALVSVFDPAGILLCNRTNARKLEQLSLNNEVVYGILPEEIIVDEHDSKFYCPLQFGQKTGWFFDQRNNRNRLKDYVKDKNVLDVFSYLGGFGIEAANFGAKSVCCIDSSEIAVGYIERNSRLNGLVDRVNVINDDAFSALKKLIDQNKKFDVIILDPPAFIKKRKDFENGFDAYFRLHKMAFQLLAQGGVLFTFSCSMHLSKSALLSVIMKSSLAVSCKVQVIEQLHQSQDHPIHPAIDETEYLKGFVILFLG